MRIPLIVFSFAAAFTGFAQRTEFHFTPADEKLLEQANALDAQFAAQGLVYQDLAAEAFLKRIGENLLAGSPPLDRVTFHFRILRDPMVNAFALPNGSIYVNTGLIAGVRNEAQLAGVLAHEITHVTGRHAYLENRSVRRKNVAIDILVAGAAAGGFAAGTTYGRTVWLASQASQALVIASVYGYSRDIERDADRKGHGRLVRANYDGAAMTQALEILDEKMEFEPSQPLPFWRTHPKLRERIATSKAMDIEMNTGRRRDTEERDYLANLATVVRYNGELDLDNRRVRTALDRSQRLVNWAPTDARNITMLADAYRGLGAKTATATGSELTAAGKKQTRNRVLERTEQEEQRELAAGPDGRRILAENRSQAEALYRRAIGIAPRLAEAHRGLGMLYEEEAKNMEAIAEYRTYLDLAPADAVDRLRIERRLERVLSRTEAK